MLCAGEFYYVDGSLSNATVIVCPALSSYPVNAFANFTIRIRTTEWTYESRTVTSSYPSQKAGVLLLQHPLNYPPSTVYQGLTYGFYLEAGQYSNSSVVFDLLDSPSEWWYDGRTTSLYLSIPQSEAAALLDDIFSIDIVLTGSPSAITVRGLSRYSLAVTHVNITEVGTAGGVSVYGSSNATTVEFSDVHISGVQGNGFNVDTNNRANTPAAVRLSHSSISDVDSNCVAVYAFSEDHPALIPVTIEYSAISRCGLSAGLGVSGDGGAQGVEVEHTRLAHNVIDNIGYLGVRPAYFSVVEYNRVTNVMRSLNDGAALYVWGAPGQGVVLRGNELVNATGNCVSSPSSYGVLANSLYLDDGDWNTTMVGNVGVGATAYCIFLHNTRNSTVADNVCYDGGWGLQADRDDLPFRNNSFAGNTFYRNGSRSLNTAVTPIIQIRTKYLNASHWYEATGNRYCDRFNAEWEGRTHRFELGLGWASHFFSNLSAWKSQTLDDPDDGTMSCPEELAVGEGGSHSGSERRAHTSRWRGHLLAVVLCFLWLH